MAETRETTIRRLYMRSIRRGIKEMDLILTAFADQHLAGMDAMTLDLYDALLSENDHDLYGWVAGQGRVPDQYGGLIARIVAGATGIVRPR